MSEDKEINFEYDIDTWINDAKKLEEGSLDDAEKLEEGSLDDVDDLLEKTEQKEESKKESKLKVVRTKKSSAKKPKTSEKPVKSEAKVKPTIRIQNYLGATAYTHLKKIFISQKSQYQSHPNRVDLLKALCIELGIDYDNDLIVETKKKTTVSIPKKATKKTKRRG